MPLMSTVRSTWQAWATFIKKPMGISMVPDS